MMTMMQGCSGWLMAAGGIVTYGSLVPGQRRLPSCRPLGRIWITSQLCVACAYRNSYLSGVATNDQSTYTYGYTTLDASVSKEIGKHLEVMLTGSNLTDSPIINYIGSGRMLSNYFERPRTYTLGIRGKF